MRRALLVAGVVLTVLLVPAAASAHPLGNFTVNRYAGIVLTPGELRIDYVVDMAEIPTVQVRPELDADGDGLVTAAERAAWARRAAPRLMANIAVAIDGEPVTLDVRAASAAFFPGQGGLDTLRLEATFATAVPGSGILTFRDENFEGRIGWREVTALGAEGTALSDPTVPARSVSDRLRSYPQDLLSSPLDVREATLGYGPGASRALPADPRAQATGPVARGGALAGLVDSTGPAMLLALVLAFGFGALHALGPGHGKTLMAAYLVGSGARVRQAVSVGGAVAVMHTASVLALGLVVVTATELFPPERVYPWLGLVSGLVALGLGGGLLVSRLGAWSTGHGHDHDHGPPHPHGAHEGSPLSRRGLAALAVAGGILPSPTALVVLLGSVALHRAAYGLALIAAFSAGLAAALIVVGSLALRARDLASRRLSMRFARIMPLVSAAAISVLGLGLTLRGFAQL